MELSIDRAVDGAGLEAGVRVAKEYHDGIVEAVFLFDRVSN